MQDIYKLKKSDSKLNHKKFEQHQNVQHPVKCLDVYIIQNDHSYYTSDSPRSIKRKLTNACDKLCSMKKRLKYTQQKSRRLLNWVDSLETVVKSLQDSKHSCGFVIGFSSKIAIHVLFS